MPVASLKGTHVPRSVMLRGMLLVLSVSPDWHSCCLPRLLLAPLHCAPCRDQFLPELLEVAYGLLRMRYLSHAWQLLQGAASWQAAEAALYLFTAVSLSVKTRVLSDAGAAAGGDENSSGGGAAGAAAAAVAADRQQTQQLLAALFRQVCSAEGGASMLGAHPALAEAVCRLVEHYSSWFGKAGATGEGEEVPLQGAFQLLLRALPIPQVGACAACGPLPLPLAGCNILGVQSSGAASLAPWRVSMACPRSATQHNTAPPPPSSLL